MKIDNKGWGLNTMLIMVVVILVFLLIATYFTIRMNSMLGIDNNKDEQKVQETINRAYYIDKINDMTDAAEKYINDNDIKLTNDPLKISMATLVGNKYMNFIKDSVTNNNCIGYAIAYYNPSNIKVVKSYIKCENYESKGYGDY